MPTIKNTVVRNMRRITLIMVAVILAVATGLQVWGNHRAASSNALQIFEQVKQILEENSRELAHTREEYIKGCLGDARTIAYILEYNPVAREDVEELRHIAATVRVDEIHIFDKRGVIVAGTHPEYFGYSFDSGEQMAFFKPLLTDRSLELVQDITPNTAEGKLVQYSALWSEDRSFILQIGMYPESVLRATRKNELSYIFSLLRTGVGYSLYAVDPETGTVVGSTVMADVNKAVGEVGLPMEQLELGGLFHAKVHGTYSFCYAQEIGGSDIIWTSPAEGFYRTILTYDLLLLAGMLLVAQFLVWAVTRTTDRTVIRQLELVNRDLRAIQEGDLTTRVKVRDSLEFVELSDHVNDMVEALLRSSEKLEMAEKIRSQKEELECQRERLEEALKQAEAACRAKSEFLFHMSHDIRTPMNAILGFTNLALEEEDPAARREYLESVNIASKQLLDLINNILEFSCLQNHKVSIEEKLTDVRELGRKLCTIFDSDLKQKGLTLTVNQEVRHPWLYLDDTHYSQIFLNVISNAIKYTPGGGTVTVTFRELPGEDPQTCRLETVIQDTGIGMSREFLANACESFARERSSTVSGIQGTGLGLTIVRELVELMGGSISIESQQGKGTRVTIRLPHRIGEDPDRKSREEDREEPDPALFRGKRVLLVEDIDINAVIARKLLMGRGFLVERARDGVECVDMLLKAEAGYYDLVLMDIQMPNMDGYEAARSIRAFQDREKAAIPILAMTANALQEDRDRAAASGMDGHIAKPLDAVKMFRRIAEVLQGRQN